jgi:hypothetical protein|tara:strand:+ start:2358 stop:2585 length:228 start_codon:yes stop_codon:yes gene_type:complete
MNCERSPRKWNFVGKVKGKNESIPEYFVAVQHLMRLRVRVEMSDMYVNISAVVRGCSSLLQSLFDLLNLLTIPDG